MHAKLIESGGPIIPDGNCLIFGGTPDPGECIIGGHPKSPPSV